MVEILYNHLQLHRSPQLCISWYLDISYVVVFIPRELATLQRRGFCLFYLVFSSPESCLLNVYHHTIGKPWHKPGLTYKEAKLTYPWTVLCICFWHFHFTILPQIINLKKINKICLFVLLWSLKLCSLNNHCSSCLMRSSTKQNSHSLRTLPFCP